MAMTPDLVGLVRSLRQIRSPVKKMRVLASAWRSFQSLDEKDRREIARQLGVAGFEKVAERIGTHGGFEPQEIQELLERLEEVDPSRAAEIIGKLGDPEGRRELTRRGLSVLRAEILESHAAPSVPGGAPAGTRDAEGGGPRGAGAESAAPERPDRGDAPLPDAGPAPSPGVDTPGVAASGSTRVTDVGPGAAGGAKAVTPRQISGGPAPDPELVGAAGPGSEEGGSPALPPPPSGDDAGPGVFPADAATVPVEDLLEELHRARSMAGRLRRLGEILRGRTLDLAGARSVAAGFPQGWPRRRAISAILRAGLPRDFGEALELLGELGTESDRSWCLSALALGRDLGDADLRRLTRPGAGRSVELRLRRLRPVPGRPADRR